MKNEEGIFIFLDDLVVNLAEVVSISPSSLDETLEISKLCVKSSILLKNGTYEYTNADIETIKEYIVGACKQDN